MEWILAHWVDLVIILMIAVYVYDGLRRGFIIILIEVVGFLASLIGAILLYAPLGELLVDRFQLSRGFSKAIGFVIAWTLLALLYTPIARALYRIIPKRFRASQANKILGGFAAIFDGALLAAFLASFIIALPFQSSVKKDIVESKIGGTLVSFTQSWESSLDSIFGGAVKETLTFITVRQGSEESVDLKFTTTEFRPSPEDETKLIELVNAERTSRGLSALKIDPLITKVSRDHSADMLKRGYFSHITPEGKSPADRADVVGVRYRIYGENIAYAPDVSIAHDGLMNSPGHRANILSPDYSRIGIGIQDAGIYGIMVTQNFAD